MGIEVHICRRACKEVGSVLYLVALSTTGFTSSEILTDRHNADPNQATTDDGTTPLLTAAQEGHDGIANQLLDHSADPNTPNNSGQTPLKVAVNNLNFTMAASLVTHGADPTATTTASSSSGFSPNLVVFDSPVKTPKVSAAWF